ncbi:MAG TPA: endonuclease/exonuclease/phosphatase family protein [Stellaceae bacterium]|nr:endonuclease/exonuclease/phosphatase family protein [Stellaceae bacterium]
MPDERATLSLFAPVAAAFATVRVVTYNIHTCVGVDRRCDPARIAAVLREIDPGIACLQEIDTRRRLDPFADQWAYLGEATGLTVVAGGGIRTHRGRFGNAILTRFPVLSSRAIDLSVGDYEPRGAIDADLLVGDRVLRVLATHFGLRLAERRWQADRLMTVLGEAPAPHRPPPDAVLLMGDLNEWRGRRGGLRALDRSLGPGAAPRTFPSWMPVLPLDRIYAAGPAVLRDVSVYRSPLARLASDHLPLVADLCWTARGRERPRRAPRGGRFAFPAPPP